MWVGGWVGGGGSCTGGILTGAQRHSGGRGGVGGLVITQRSDNTQQAAAVSCVDYLWSWQKEGVEGKCGFWSWLWLQGVCVCGGGCCPLPVAQLSWQLLIRACWSSQLGQQVCDDASRPQSTAASCAQHPV